MARDVKLGIGSSSYTYKPNIHERSSFHYALITFIIISLVVSTMTLVYVVQLKKAILPNTINTSDFLKKLTAHAEMKAYVGVAPLNIIQINNNNFANLQTQISGLDTSYIGNFLVQYTDRIVVYAYEKDQIRGAVALQQPQGQVPENFFAKLNKHPELKGLQYEQPIGGQLDEPSLNTLKQQFPDVYANAKVGDFLLRYKTKLIIYDYNADSVVNAVDLQ